MANISSLLRNKLLGIQEYSDLTLKCHGEEFLVHKAIVCPQSPVIAAALKSGFKEAKTGELSVAFDAESVRRLIEFMYAGDYRVSPDPNCAINGKKPDDMESGDEDEGVDTVGLDSDTRVVDRLICHCLMNSIADYYDMPALATLSSSKVQAILANEWSADSFYIMIQESLAMKNDKSFLRMLGTVAMDHIDDVLETGLFEEGGPGEKIALYALSNCLPRLAAAKAHERELILRLSIEKGAVEQMSQESSRLSRSIDAGILLFQKHESCRNSGCKTEFPCYLQDIGSSTVPSYVLRCTRCQYPHE